MKLSAMLKVRAIARSNAIVVSFLMPARRSIKSPDDDIPRRGSSHVDIDAVIGADDGLIGTLYPSDVDAFLSWAAGMDDADGVVLESNRQGRPATLNHDFFVFYDPDLGATNVVYRRKDGKYGLLSPELK